VSDGAQWIPGDDDLHRWRGLAELARPRATDPLAPGVLGEYAVFRRLRGVAKADATFPEVVAHVESGCAQCAEDLAELDELALTETTPSRRGGVSQVRRWLADLGQEPSTLAIPGVARGSPAAAGAGPAAVGQWSVRERPDVRVTVELHPTSLRILLTPIPEVAGWRVRCRMQGAEIGTKSTDSLGQVEFAGLSVAQSSDLELGVQPPSADANTWMTAAPDRA
jgi:hypothetical protein